MDYSFLQKKKTDTPVKSGVDYSFLKKDYQPPKPVEQAFTIDKSAFNVLAQPISTTIKTSTPEAIEPKKNIVSKSVDWIKKEIADDKALQGKDEAAKAKVLEKRTERTAKVLTAPIRFTAGSLATAATSFALERADSNAKYTPKTDAEKLIIGEGDIQRLSKQEDIYGTIAKGVGIPAALMAMAVIENPFVAGTGLNKVIKGALEKKISELGAEQLSKLGTKEIIKIADDTIKAEKVAGKLTEKDATKATEIIKSVRVKPVEKFSDWKIKNPNPQPAEVKEVKAPANQPIRIVPEEKPADLRQKVTYEPTIAQPSVPNRIKNEVIEKGIADDLKGITEYDKVSFKDQAERVGQIIDENPEKAINIALGKELPTNGALPESVFIAVKNQALKNNDIELLRRLATEEGGVARESTVLGQRIKMLDEQLEDDAFSNINRVVKARRASFEAKNGNAVIATKKEVSRIKETIKAAKATKDEWANFVSEITC